MELRGIVIAVGAVIVTVQLGLFAWLKADIGSLADRTKADIGALTERVDRVEREVAFVRGQPSLSLPLPPVALGSESGSYGKCNVVASTTLKFSLTT